MWAAPLFGVRERGVVNGEEGRGRRNETGGSEGESFLRGDVHAQAPRHLKGELLKGDTVC